MIPVTEYDGISPADAELRREAVYKVIVELGAPTNKQIAAYLGWPINCVTGRTYELRREGRVVEGEKVIDRHTKKWVHTWMPKEGRE